MSPIEILQGVLTGVVGGAAWIKLHRHDDLVPRTEFTLVVQRLDEIRVDIRELRDQLDRLKLGR